MSDKQPVNVGLLIAHGIGQQKRYETIRALAAALRDEIGNGQCSVIDRTGDSAQLPPSCPAVGPDSAPITLVCARKDAPPLSIHLHEAWWADLGAGKGLFDQLRFWLWGLGQAGETVKLSTSRHRTNTDQLMLMPGKGQPFDPDRGAPGHLGLIPRFALAAAAVQAVWTVMSWEALRAVLARFVPSLAGSALLVQYLGDVRTYTAKADPGQANLLDPGLPMRATIRRRMIREMVAMGERGYDRWYVMGHSLGSVLVFNGMQEPEPNLANYLDCDQWQRVVEAGTLATDAAYLPSGVELSYNKMMPRRPTWLAPGQGIDRTVLFANFRGLITYGSPLDKFAALWPRLVAINRQPGVFSPETDWLNLSDATDPVGAELQYFGGTWASSDANNRGPHNRRDAASRAFLYAHLGYFSRKGRPDTAALKQALLDGTRLSQAFSAVDSGYGPRWLRWVMAGGGGLALGLTLFVAASLAVKLGSAALAKLGWIQALSLASSAKTALAGPVALVAVTVAARWLRNRFGK